jgi:hypothetical protein
MAWTTPRTWNPGETVTANLLNTHLRDNLNTLFTYFSTQGVPSGFLLSAYQTAAVTKNTSTSYSDLTGLAFSVAAGENWAWVGAFYATAASATPNMKFTYTGPAAATAITFGVFGFATPITAGYVSAFGSDAIYTKGVIPEIICTAGLLRNGASAGTVQAQFAQNTSNASNSIINAESWILALRLL